MRTNVALAILVIVLIAAGAAGVFYIYRVRNASIPAIVSRPSPSPTTAPKESFPSSEASASPQVQPQSGSETLGINLGIAISTPASGQTISSPVKVKGVANVENQKVTIRIKDENGNVLGNGLAQACLDVNPCPFEASVVFSNPSTQKGTVEVTDENYIQSISVNFL